MTDGLLQDEASAARLKAAIPYPRFGDPDDIAAAATYLAGGESDFMNGETIVIDGGQVAQ